MDVPTTSFDDVLTCHLGDALDDHDHARAARLLLEAEATIERDERIDVRALLTLLNVHERFTEAALLGRLALERRPGATVALPYAQALIGAGRCTDAVAILHGWEPSWIDDRRAIDMALGSAYEQLYLDAHPNALEPRAHDLEQALRRYRACFQGRLDHPLWEGDDPPLCEAIGVVALLQHAHRRAPRRDRGEVLAARVLEVALRQLERDDDPRLFGIALEACLVDVVERGRLERLLAPYVSDPRVPLLALQQTLRRMWRLWELDPQQPGDGLVLRQLQEACAARGGRSASLSAGAETFNCREARWWYIDEHGRQQPGSAELKRKRCGHPLVGTNLHRLRFRVVTEAITRLEYLGDDDQWIGTRTYGDLFVNRVNLGLFDHILLDISGRDHRGEEITVGGWYHMNGTYYAFGPGRPGQSILVEIETLVSEEDPLQIFNFQVEGRTSSGRAFSYDPVVLLAPVKGELTKSG